MQCTLSYQQRYTEITHDPIFFSVAQGIFWLSSERLSRNTLRLIDGGEGSLYSCTLYNCIHPCCPASTALWGRASTYILHLSGLQPKADKEKSRESRKKLFLNFYKSWRIIYLLWRWWEVVGNSELVKSGINRLSNTEWWKEKTSKKMTLQLEVSWSIINYLFSSLMFCRPSTWVLNTRCYF